MLKGGGESERTVSSISRSGRVVLKIVLQGALTRAYYSTRTAGSFVRVQTGMVEFTKSGGEV